MSLIIWIEHPVLDVLQDKEKMVPITLIVSEDLPEQPSHPQDVQLVFHNLVPNVVPPETWLDVDVNLEVLELVEEYKLEEKEIKVLLL